MNRPTTHFLFFELRTRPLLFLACCMIFFPFSATAQPEERRNASAVLSLVFYTHELCDGIAGRTLNEWEGYGGTSEVRLQVLDYLAAEAEDLAQGRETADIVRELLPGARSEVGSETHASLVRLSTHARKLCDLVVELPEGNSDNLDSAIQRVLDDYEREEAELGRLFEVAPEELEEARRSHLQRIQLAGFNARNEYLDHLESLKVPEKGPTRQERMEAWYQGYRKAVRPAREALGRYVAARKKNDVRGMSKACREISKTLVPLLNNEDVFKVPTPAVPASKGWEWKLLPPLREAYREMREMARNCSAGRSREVQEHLTGMQEELGRAAAFLGRFSLTP